MLRSKNNRAFSYNSTFRRIFTRRPNQQKHKKKIKSWAKELGLEFNSDNNKANFFG